MTPAKRRAHLVRMVKAGLLSMADYSREDRRIVLETVSHYGTVGGRRIA